MFVARGHHFLWKSWKKSRKVEKVEEPAAPDDLRRRLPPQIEGPPRTIFMEILKIMKILEILMKFQKFLEFIPKKSLKTLGKMNDFHSDHESDLNFLKFHENMKISLKSCNISSSCSIRSTACRTISKLPRAQFFIKKLFSCKYPEIGK